MSQVVFVLGLLLTFPCHAWAQAATPLVKQLESLRSASNLPAVGGAIFDSAKVVEVFVTGVRKLGDPTPVTADDLWHVGSITKSVTATLVGRFVERGQLSWTATLGELLGAKRAQKFAPVTLAQVLSHRAGLLRDLPPAELDAMYDSLDSPREQRRAAIERVLAGEPLSAPGATYLYSNLGYVLIGAILEEKMGQSWEQLVRTEVLAPLKLTTVGFGAPGTIDSISQPWGHRVEGPVLVPIEPGPLADNPQLYGPAGTLHMSLGDLARWGQEHLRGERGTSGLLNADTYKTLHTPPAGAQYAFGWMIQERSGSRVIWHNGSNTAWYCIIAFDAAADRGVIVATNGSNKAASAIDAAAMALLTGR